MQLKIKLIFLLAVVLTINVNARAHGGEDHSEQKAPVVQAGAGVETRAARVGDLEVTIKHQSVEPDKSSVARLFITEYATNTPVEAAQVRVRFGDDTANEIAAMKTSSAGIYEVTLPPVPQGHYTLTARVESKTSSGDATFGQINVAPRAVESAANTASWARTILIAIGGLIALGILAFVGYRLVGNTRRASTQSRSEEGVTAA